MNDDPIRTTEKKARRKRALRIAALCVLLALAIDLAATKIVYDGIFARFDAPAEEEYSLSAEQGCEYSFECRGVTLCGRLFSPAPGCGNGALVVAMPGLRSGYAELMPQTLALTELGYTVFAFDPTGCRSSGGRNAGGFPQAVYDIGSCIDFVEENELFGCKSLLLFGHSRGGYAVCCAASDGHDIAGIVSVSAPNSPMDAVIAPSSVAVGIVGAYSNYPMLWLYQTMLFGARGVGLRADRSLCASGVPVLIVAGSGDPVYTDSRFSLYSHRGDMASANASFLLLEGGHTDLMLDGEGGASAEFIDAVHGFYTGCITAAPLG